jgi:hypothetical protein
MNNITALFRQLMVKFKFEFPIPEDIQKFILSNKHSLAVKVLKSVDNYGLFYGLVLRIYFGAKKMGLSLSVAQSIFMLWVISASITSLLAAGMYFAYYDDENIRSINPSNNMPLNSIEKTDDSGAEKQFKKRNTPQAGSAVRIGIQLFSAENTDNKTAESITDSIASTLVGLKGKDIIFNLRKGRTASINKIITGSVGKLGDTYIITAKMIDIEKSKVIYVTSENVNSSEKFNEACKKIGTRISDNIQ